MPNYKPYGKSYLGGQWYKVTVPDSDIVILEDFANSATVADGMIDTVDQLIYQVPAGKQLNVIMVYHTHSTNIVTVTWSTGDTEDAETATKLIVTNAAVAGLTEFPCKIFFAAGKFITYNPSNTSVMTLGLIGYLTNA